MSHDESLDILAVTENSGLTRTHRPRSDASSVRDLSTRERGIATPSVVGASGGVRQKHINKKLEFKSTSQKENLTETSQRVSMATGMKASKPSSTTNKPEHEHAEERFSEEETGGRVRGAPKLRKATDTSKFRQSEPGNQFSLGNSKDGINSTPFTSTNLAAPEQESTCFPQSSTDGKSIAIGKRYFS